MKLDRIMWGIVLLFIGAVLLLQNFDIIDFYWRSVWRFWPIFLIIAGVNILFSRSKSQLAGIISIAILTITLILLFIKGQQQPGYKNRITERIEEERIEIGPESENLNEQHLSLPYTNDSITARTILNISGGGTSFDLKGQTDSLISAVVNQQGEKFLLVKNLTADSVTILDLKMARKGKWNTGGNGVDLKLNTMPTWEFHINMGAGEIDFDLSDYKVREFNFDGGAAALDIKLGSLVPITDVNIKTGVADVKIKIPTGSGCQIRAKTGLSAKEFTGFTKLNDNTYETPNYKDAKNKIFINFDGGLSSFEVNRY